MKQIQFPYGKSKLAYSFAESALAGVLTSAIGEYEPEGCPEELVKRALAAPIGSARLGELARLPQSSWPPCCCTSSR